MKEKELRRTLAVLSIGTVIKLTDLSARQIRYYESQGMVHPQRNAGNQRQYSLNDVDRLLEIKDYLADGLNMAGIQAVYEKQKNELDDSSLEDDTIRKLLREELLAISGLSDDRRTQFFQDKA